MWCVRVCMCEREREQREGGEREISGNHYNNYGSTHVHVISYSWKILRSKIFSWFLRIIV